jgi:hypothetical protein
MEFPTVEVAIHNDSATQAKIISKVEAEAHCTSLAVVPTTRALERLATWDVEIVCNDKKETPASSLIEIAPNDVGAVRVRLFARNGFGTTIIPSSSVQSVRLTFLSDDPEPVYSIEYTLVGGTLIQTGPTIDSSSPSSSTRVWTKPEARTMETVRSLQARLAQPRAEASFGTDSRAVPALRLLSTDALTFFVLTFCVADLDRHEFMDPNDLNNPDFARPQIELISQKLVARDGRRPGVILLTDLGKSARRVVKSIASQ